MAAGRHAEALWAEEALAKASGLVLACSLKEQALGRPICSVWHILDQKPALSSIWELMSVGPISCLLYPHVTESHRPDLAPLATAMVG